MAGRLRRAVHEMDSTRPVLGAFNGGYLRRRGGPVSDAVGNQPQPDAL